ncbi:MAG: prepilin-type N-terminal cleavage/methylation domain-containing protein, partial [Peptococcaceae bacterium]|nr:prepilin-type N-terminal cleavage/methylation domain-containing protein [Peptococcaceae bacterium]
QGFTLVEMMLSTLLLSMICLIVWGLLGQYILLWRQTGDTADLCDGLRLSMNRMSREIRYAKSISAVSDLSRIYFVNAKGDQVSYYSLNNQLLRRENGTTAPLASNINSISFTYKNQQGLVIDQTNYDQETQSMEWVDGISMITVTLTAGKPGGLIEPITLMRKINLRILP